MRRLGLIFRWLATGASVTLFVAVVIVWVRGYWARDAIYLIRRTLDERGLHVRSWAIEWGKGDVTVQQQVLDDDEKRAASLGIPMGTSWATADYHNEPSPLRANLAAWGASISSGNAGVSVWHHGGIVVARVEWRATGDRETTCSVPCWMPAIIFAVLPTERGWAWARRRGRARRAKYGGLCPACGYDLRATPTPASAGGGRLAVCPECGRRAGGEGETASNVARDY